MRSKTGRERAGRIEAVVEEMDDDGSGIRRYYLEASFEPATLGLPEEYQIVGVQLVDRDSGGDAFYEPERPPVVWKKERLISTREAVGLFLGSIFLVAAIIAGVRYLGLG